LFSPRRRSSASPPPRWRRVRSTRSRRSTFGTSFFLWLPGLARHQWLRRCPRWLPRRTNRSSSSRRLRFLQRLPSLPSRLPNPRFWKSPRCRSRPVRLPRCRNLLWHLWPSRFRPLRRPVLRFRRLRLPPTNPGLSTTPAWLRRCRKLCPRLRLRQPFLNPLLLLPLLRVCASATWWVGSIWIGSAVDEVLRSLPPVTTGAVALGTAGVVARPFRGLPDRRRWVDAPRLPRPDPPNRGSRLLSMRR